MTRPPAPQSRTQRRANAAEQQLRALLCAARSETPAPELLDGIVRGAAREQRHLYGAKPWQPATTHPRAQQNSPRLAPQCLAWSAAAALLLGVSGALLLEEPREATEIVAEASDTSRHLGRETLSPNSSSDSVPQRDLSAPSSPQGPSDEEASVEPATHAKVATSHGRDGRPLRGRQVAFPPIPLPSDSSSANTPALDSRSAGAGVIDPAALAAQYADQRRSSEQQALEARARATATAHCVPARCDPVRPSDALITDFEALGPNLVFVDGDSYATAPGDWWQRFYGSPYVFPQSNAGLQQEIRAKWLVEGTVATWSGMGFWLGACMVDMSAYRGVSFELWGNAGPSQAMTFAVPSQENTEPESCRSNVGSCEHGKHGCRAAKRRIRVPLEKGHITRVLWSELDGGSPSRSPDPHGILQLQWLFDWSESSEATRPYGVSVRLDNVRLIE